MTHDAAVAIVRQLQEAANRHDVAAILDFYADEAISIGPVFDEVRGRAAIAATWHALFSRFPDCALEVGDVLVDGDRVIVFGTVKFIDRAGWFGLPATRTAVDYRIVLLLTFAADKIVRDERVYDSAGVIARLEKALLDKEVRTASEVQQALVPRTVRTGRNFEAAGDAVPWRHHWEEVRNACYAVVLSKRGLNANGPEHWKFQNSKFLNF